MDKYEQQVNDMLGDRFNEDDFDVISGSSTKADGGHWVTVLMFVYDDDVAGDDDDDWDAERRENAELEGDDFADMERL